MHRIEPNPVDCTDEAMAYERCLRERFATFEREPEVLTLPHWLDCPELLEVEVAKVVDRYGASLSLDRSRCDHVTLDAAKFAAPWRDSKGRIRHFEESHHGYLKDHLLAVDAVWFEFRMRHDDPSAPLALSEKITEGRVGTEEEVIDFLIMHHSEDVFVFPDGSALTSRWRGWSVLSPNMQSLSGGIRYLPVTAYLRLTEVVEELFRRTSSDWWSRVARVVYGRMPEVLLQCPSSSVRSWAITHLSDFLGKRPDATADPD